MKEENLKKESDTVVSNGNGSNPAGGNRGLIFRRFFTTDGKHPFDEIEWEKRKTVISGDNGSVVFEQNDVEIPKFWSQVAATVVASKYFRGTLGTKERESSIRMLIGRVVNTIMKWGLKDGYFSTQQDADIFGEELAHLLLYQKASFNSPVWFNCGVEEKPQCSACFINSVEDTMESILDLAKIEGMLFKHGSGAGTNLSKIRSSREILTGGGTASGPVSFMKGYDAFAGVIKSGGKTRRAAKMVILNIDHPDIVDFIKCKVEEEKKAWALIDAGYDGSFNSEAYNSVFFQNSNNSVRVTDEFMYAVLEDKNWNTKAVTTGKTLDTYKAKDLLKMIADGTYVCGDPGMQFDTNVNSWNTCPNSGRINASNPCSEYMFLDNSACNLSSLNLMKFRTFNDEFDVTAFRYAVRVLITAQEIIVDNASYPTPSIGKNSHLYRALGLGYANLGALLMSLGLPYDSDAGRNYAAAITSLMTAEAYATSALISKEMGPFNEYEKNKDSMLKVMERHRNCAKTIDGTYVPSSLYSASVKTWDEAYELGSQHGYRNAQVTLLAPTGTIGFMMDCDTTGIEPDMALVKYKKLVGGGVLKIVNNTVASALTKLNYNENQIRDIISYMNENDTIEGSPHIKEDDLPVFDCAFKPLKGKRSIHYMGHIRMMGAVQPFLSGAISKTVNVPNEVALEEIMNIYLEAWKLGVKAIAIYRDGSKRTQPLTTAKKEKVFVSSSENIGREKLPAERRSITHKFEIAGHDGYITVGMYEDGRPGEIFLVMAKEGSTISGLMDAFATSVSIALQYGVPLKALVDKFVHTRFEPSGFTKNREIPIAKSITDYIFRWLASKFLSKEEQREAGILIAVNSTDAKAEEQKSDASAGKKVSFLLQQDAPSCQTCGSIMVRNGSCYKCLNCGSTSGCS